MEWIHVVLLVGPLTVYLISLFFFNYVKKPCHQMKGREFQVYYKKSNSIFVMVWAKEYNGFYSHLEYQGLNFFSSFMSCDKKNCKTIAKRFLQNGWKKRHSFNMTEREKEIVSELENQIDDDMDYILSN